MPDSNEPTNELTVEEYIISVSPNANISMNTVKGVLIDAGIEEGTYAKDLTERQKDLSLAYLLIRLASNPIMSQKTTDKDAGWEHSEGNERWAKSQLLEFLRTARALLKKWGIADARLESVETQWKVVGRGFRNKRRYV